MLATTRTRVLPTLCAQRDQPVQWKAALLPPEVLDRSRGQE